MTDTRHESKSPRSRYEEFEVIHNALFSVEMFIEKSAISFQPTPLKTLESEASFLRSVLAIANTSSDLSVGECILKAKINNPGLSRAASSQLFLGLFEIETPTGALIRIHERKAEEIKESPSCWSSLFSIFSDNKSESSILMQEIKKQNSYGACEFISSSAPTSSAVRPSRLNT